MTSIFDFYKVLRKVKGVTGDVDMGDLEQKLIRYRNVV